MIKMSIKKDLINWIREVKKDVSFWEQLGIGYYQWKRIIFNSVLLLIFFGIITFVTVKIFNLHIGLLIFGILMFISVTGTLVEFTVLCIEDIKDVKDNVEREGK